MNLNIFKKKDESTMPIELDYPYVIKDVLLIKDFNILRDELRHGWSLDNYSDDTRYKDAKRFWSIRERDLNEIVLDKVGSIIKLKVQKILKTPLETIRCHINGQTFGQSGKFHIDYSADNVWTFILFTSHTWNVNWGGEFICYHPIQKEYRYVSYIPNTGCLIPSNWDHYGSAPNDQTDLLRTSVAYSFKKSSIT